MTDQLIYHEEDAALRPLVEHYIENQAKLRGFLEQVDGVFRNSEELSKLIHSSRGRLKDPAHLLHKLRRKRSNAENGQMDIDRTNLFVKITDLVGYRVLHLHTKQFEGINKVIREILSEARYELIEEPFARTWDDESRRYFNKLGLKTPTDKESFYTSVHYVFRSNSRTHWTAELQVRTLAEEVWGEVDHKWNYPDPTRFLACSEQIAALARVTSSCSRLVDSIFATGHEARAREAKETPEGPTPVVVPPRNA
jgi:ppGpp synthetase/RelA/SpoT-type nucleotidyltranferase